jgi:hypothetical protein
MLKFFSSGNDKIIGKRKKKVNGIKILSPSIAKLSKDITYGEKMSEMPL